MLPSTDTTISNAIDQTVQSRVRKQPESNISLVWWMAKAGLYLSPWWSPNRDNELREFWKKTDHLAGAVFTMTAKMTSIDFEVRPRDTGDKQAARQAAALTELLRSASQFGDGWPTFYSRFVEDMVTQDNGAFAEIIGPGDPAGPLTGQPVTIAHLDASRCQRTGNATYPVLYRNEDGKLYKMHYTRVLYTAQMSSPIAEMNGVGFCAVSRCVNVSQTLLDILTFKQEKLGSRPHRAILIPRGGLDPSDIANAFQIAENETDNMGLSRYSKVVVAGSSSIEDADLKVIELSSLPEGFNEETSVTLGMATIALAFGMDARELFPGLTSGATRADALLQHLKQRSKGPGQILEATELLFNHKFLPTHMQLVFDFQDDAQDRQIADIKKVRAERRVLDLNAGTIDKHTAREQMLESGDLSQSQFVMQELIDGRLEDGLHVLNLFYRDDPLLKDYLDLSVKDPLNLMKNDPLKLLPVIYRKIADISTFLMNDCPTDEKMHVFAGLSALIHLKNKYVSVVKNLPDIDEGLRIQLMSESTDAFSQEVPEIPPTATTLQAGNSKLMPQRRQESANPNLNQEANPSNRVSGNRESKDAGA